MVDGPRTTFGRRPGAAAKAALVAGLGVVLLAGAVLVRYAVTFPRGIPVFVLLLLAGVVLVIAGISGLRSALQAYRLTFGADGIAVRTRGQDVRLGWADIEDWWVGVPEDRMARTVQRAMLLARPATHVTDPAAGSRRLLWSAQRRCWVVCEPVLTDGSPEEIAAAAQTYAPDKRRPDRTPP